MKKVTEFKEAVELRSTRVAGKMTNAELSVVVIYTLECGHTAKRPGGSSPATRLKCGECE